MSNYWVISKKAVERMSKKYEKQCREINSNKIWQKVADLREGYRKPPQCVTLSKYVVEISNVKK